MAARKLGLSVRAHADEPRLGHAHHHAMYEFETHNGLILVEALGMSSVKPQFGTIRPDPGPMPKTIRTASGEQWTARKGLGQPDAPEFERLAAQPLESAQDRFASSTIASNWFCEWMPSFL